jgi:hypothetical protein
MRAAVARKEPATDCEARGLATDGGVSPVAMAKPGAARPNEWRSISPKSTANSALVPSRSRRSVELVVKI